MALHDVPAKSPVRFHWKFQVHERALVHARERGADPCLRCEIGAERAGFDIESGQANAADRNAVAGFQFPWSVFGCNGDAAILAMLFDAGDASYLGDDASEHKIPQDEPNIINPIQARRNPEKQIRGQVFATTWAVTASFFVGIAKVSFHSEVFFETMQLEVV